MVDMVGLEPTIAVPITTYRFRRPWGLHIHFKYIWKANVGYDPYRLFTCRLCFSSISLTVHFMSSFLVHT